VSHFGPGFGPLSAYGTSKLAAASIVEYLQFENPEINTFNVSPGMVLSDMSIKAGMQEGMANDSPNLMGHLAVWLASPESEFLKGRFIWANWDIEDLVKAKEEIIKQPGLFRLTLDGWSKKLDVSQ
jgi:NAD(P)-dependent dehydrogenase (short-subunit alcohol dehydrogenase family)